MNNKLRHYCFSPGLPGGFVWGAGRFPGIATNPMKTGRYF
jgi:hypothetical protein